MPVYRKPSVEVDELHLPTQPACVVRMRRRGETGMGYDAEDYILTHRREFQANGNGTVPEQEILAKSYSVAYWELLTLALIVDWDLEDEAGKRWPYTVASLRALDPVDGAYLESEARRRMEGMDSPFGSTLPTPSLESRPTTPESPELSSSSSSPASTAGLQTLSADSSPTT